MCVEYVDADNTRTHPIEVVADDEDNIGPATCVEYVDADNTRFLISIIASATEHQF